MRYREDLGPADVRLPVDSRRSFRAGRYPCMRCGRERCDFDEELCRSCERLSQEEEDSR